MANPYELRSKKTIWVDAKGNVVPSSGPSAKVQLEEQTYANGEVYRQRWDPVAQSWTDAELVDVNKAIADQFEARQKAEAASESASAWALEDRDDGTYRVNKATGEARKVEGLPSKKPAPSPVDIAKSTYDEASYKAKLAELLNPKPDARQVDRSILERDAEGNWVVKYTAPREPTGQLTAYQSWQMGNYPAEQEEVKRRFDIQELRAQQDREAEMLRNQLTNRTSLENTRAQLWEKTAPWLLPEEQDYFPGYEVGGPYDKLLKMSGVSNYQPYRPGRTQFEFDPNLIWRLGQTGGK